MRNISMLFSIIGLIILSSSCNKEDLIFDKNDPEGWTYEMTYVNKTGTSPLKLGYYWGKPGTYYYYSEIEFYGSDTTFNLTYSKVSLPDACSYDSIEVSCPKFGKRMYRRDSASDISGPNPCDSACYDQKKLSSTHYLYEFVIE